MPISVAIILFCFIVFIIFMVIMIASELNENRRLIIEGYGYSNALESARCFEKTGIDLDSHIPYLNKTHEPHDGYDDGYNFVIDDSSGKSTPTASDEKFG
jgi:hypothetical protein